VYAPIWFFSKDEYLDLFNFQSFNSIPYILKVNVYNFRVLRKPILYNLFGPALSQSVSHDGTIIVAIFSRNWVWFLSGISIVFNEWESELEDKPCWDNYLELQVTGYKLSTVRYKHFMYVFLHSALWRLVCEQSISYFLSPSSKKGVAISNPNL
jgi:hypothetical protein